MSLESELAPEHFERAIPAKVHRRFRRGLVETAEDIVLLRRYLAMTQVQLAGALGISVHTLRNWEQGRRFPEGPALALLRIAARHPRIIRESASTAA